MFDIGWSELLVIAVVAVLVFGPKELPRLMRTFGHYSGKLRRAAADFQRQFEEAVRESEIDEVRKAMQDVGDRSQTVDLKAPIDKPLMTPTAPPAAAAPPSQMQLPGASSAPKPGRKPVAKRTAKSRAKTTVAAKPRKSKGPSR